MEILTLVMLTPDIAHFENSVDPDQLVSGLTLLSTACKYMPTINWIITAFFLRKTRLKIGEELQKLSRIIGVYLSGI